MLRDGLWWSMRSAVPKFTFRFADDSLPASGDLRTACFPVNALGGNSQHVVLLAPANTPAIYAVPAAEETK